MSKRLIACVTALLMIVTLLPPARVYAAEYDIYVLGIRVTDANKNNITGNSGTPNVTYDPDSNTLTLNGWYYTYSGKDMYNVIKSNTSFTIELKGSNYIKLENPSAPSNVYGILASSSTVTFSGSGSLQMEITGGPHNNYGIRASKIVMDGGTITVREECASDLQHNAIYATQLTINDGKLTASGSGKRAIYLGEPYTPLSFGKYYNPVIKASLTDFYGNGAVTVTKSEFISTNKEQGYKFVEFTKSTQTFTVTFDSKGGTPVPSQTVEYGETATKPATDPTKEGYAFAGWVNESNINYSFTSAIHEDTTLYAKWLKLYTVSFDTDGGSAVPDQIVKETYYATQPSDPTKEGYSFDGWYTSSSFSEKFVFYSMYITSDTTIYAKWKPLKYYVYFNSNGGSYVLEQQIEYGQKATVPEEPTKEGYGFIGWYKDSALTEEFDFDAPITGTTTVYAKWDEDCTVTFDTDGGSAIAAVTVGYGETVLKPANPTKEGYTFGGWYKDSAYTENFDFTAGITSNVTVYAKWNAIPYTVKFDTDGGSAVADQVVEYGQKAVKPTNPTKDGCGFGGWYKDSALSDKYDFEKPVTADLTLYAKWNPITYTVTFETNGGSAVAAATVEHGQTVTKPADPTKAEYTFGGWYKDGGFTGKFDFSAPITADITVYAKWNLITYTVTFETNGGSAAESALVGEGEIVLQPADPTKEGYYFDGWYKDSALTEKFDFDAPITADTTVYAKWKDIIYTVIFDTDGGSEIADAVVGYGKTVSKPADPTKAGYAFSGWYKDGALTEAFDFEAVITGDTVVYAKWTILCSVIFNTDSGSPVADQAVIEGQKATKPAEPTKEGYTFGGWYKDSIISEVYDFDAPVTSDITIYAKWDLITCTVTYETDGGSAVAGQTVEYGQKAGKPADPVKAGYAFGGWYKDSALTEAFDFDVPVTADITVYAKWNVVTSPVTVTFETDGGSAVSAQTVEKGQKAGKPADPAKAGYAFGGWYKDSALTQAFDFDAPVTADITVYAKWNIITYTVTFKTDGGSAVASQTVESGKKASKPADPAKAGYSFGGWYKDSALTEAFDFNAPVTANMTVYAKWNVITSPVTVTFETNDGSAVAAQTVEKGQKASKPADPARAGFGFGGWYKDSALTEEFDFDAAITADTTVYARWYYITYTVTFNTNGGSGVGSAVVGEGEKVSKPSDPIRAGYTFGGWYKDSALTEAFDFDAPVTANTTIYAKWNIITYTVTFETNGGSAVASQTVESGQKAAKPADPAKDGYTFGGWYKDSVLTEAFDFNAPITADTTVYAKWTEAVPDHIPGDINNDGVVNNKDLIRLMKYIAGEAVEVNELATDVNGDGKVNNKDLIRLMKYIAGEDVMVY